MHIVNKTGVKVYLERLELSRNVVKWKPYTFTERLLEYTTVL